VIAVRSNFIADGIVFHRPLKIVAGENPEIYAGEDTQTSFYVDDALLAFESVCAPGIAQEEIPLLAIDVGVISRSSPSFSRTA
jgi:hypothetical protein